MHRGAKQSIVISGNYLMAKIFYIVDTLANLKV